MAKTRSGGKSKISNDEPSKEALDGSTELSDCEIIRKPDDKGEACKKGTPRTHKGKEVVDNKRERTVKNQDHAATSARKGTRGTSNIKKAADRSIETEDAAASSSNKKARKAAKGKNTDKLADKKKVVESKMQSKSKMSGKSAQAVEEDVKPAFFGYKCYFDKIITEVKRVGSKMDTRTKDFLMKTSFAGFFQAILDEKIASAMVQKCDASMIDIIHMYEGTGQAFRFTKNGPIVELKETTVSCVFGIKMGRKLFDTHERIIGKPGVFEAKYFTVRRISRKELSVEMTKLVSKEHLEDEERQDLVKMLILYCFATFFFANTSGTVAKAIVKKFDDMAYINRCCWPTLIHSYLLESIEKHYKAATPNVSGCVYLLLYFFLEHTGVRKAIEGREAGEPRMTKWSLGEATGENWAETLKTNATKKSAEILLILSPTERESLEIPSTGLELTVVNQENTSTGMIVEKEKRSKKYHDTRSKKQTEKALEIRDTVESDGERTCLVQSEAVLKDQEDTIKHLIASAQGYRIQLKDKDREILKAKETVDALRKEVDFMRAEKKQFDKEMIAEKKRYIDLYDRDMVAEKRLKKEIAEKDALLLKLNEEIKQLKMENEELTTLAGEMGDVKADNINLSKQIEHLNSVVHELRNQGGQNMEGAVHDAVPLNTVETTDDFQEMPATRGRGGSKKKVVDDTDQTKTTVYKRKQKDAPAPSSLTKRVKGRHSKQVSAVTMIEVKDGTEKLINPENSKLFSVLEPGARSLLIANYMYSNRSKQVWESEDSLGKLILNAGMIEDLYIGSWLSNDLVDWFFRWRIPNLKDKYPGIRDTQMSGCFSIRAASYTHWKSDATRESGMKMVKKDIGANIKYNTYQSAMFVPMLVDENHWVLLILDIDNLQWYVYNSRPGEEFQRDEATVAADSFRKYLQKILLPKIKKARKDNSLEFQENILQETGPVQENRYDCVLFICKYAEHRIMGGSYIWDQKQVYKLRAEFIDTIMLTEGHNRLSYSMKE